jgi:hypothetical protein
MGKKTGQGLLQQYLEPSVNYKYDWMNNLMTFDKDHNSSTTLVLWIGNIKNEHAS